MTEEKTGDTHKYREVMQRGGKRGKGKKATGSAVRMWKVGWKMIARGPKMFKAEE